MKQIASCSDRVDVFAQAGSVTVPQQASALMAYLEPMVHVVRRPRPGGLFHPKTWFLRFSAEDGEVRHRLLVLSRNLTGDRSWDTCLTLEGVPEGTPKAANRPLAALLRALPDLATSTLNAARRDRIVALAEEVRRVAWQAPPDVSAMSFHLLGVPGAGSLPNFDGTRHLVVSPFCNEAGLRRVLPQDSRKWDLVSRQETLDALPVEWTEEATCRVLDASCGLGEDDPDTGGLQGLHAKVFVVERGHRARTFVGSANATDAAFGGNVEILVELEGTRSKLGIDALLADTSSSFLCVLQDYGRQPAVEDDAGQRALENALRVVAEIPFRVRIRADGTSYGWRLTSSGPVRLPDGVTSTAAPLTRREQGATLTAGKAVDLTFTGLALTDVTPFVLLSATDGQRTCSTVVPARLDGDPPGRLDAILAKQLQTPADFIRFVKLLLGLVGDAVEPGTAEGAGTTGAWQASSQGLFELLVRALADQPEALEGLAGLVGRLQATEAGRRLLPDGFDELWSAVQAVRSAKRRRS